ncbi:hypothetical protein CesoFtcFv8_011781 [Champsocephalus esox]|uniref:Uncharacterized protein n=1 Tax=Champsocephalus esox TaxID=159716 RepID=A0AAN8GY28_9TELE|nr:hypothetical protein CesoFtcFv8_011781 [Champsocephalus esox]
MSGETGRRRGNPRETLPAHCGISPSDTLGTQKGVTARPCSPSLTCAWCLHQISLTITELEAKTYCTVKSQAL